MSFSFISGTLVFFTSEKPSNDESHPDYIPSVFPTKKTNQLANSKKIDRYNSAKRHASPNLANSSKIVMVTNISDQPSSAKPEPVFIGLESIGGPDPEGFSSYSSVSNYAVGTNADELVSPTISNITTTHTKVIVSISSSTKIKHVRNSQKGRYDTVLIKYPNYIRQTTINGDGFPPIRKGYIAEKN